MARLGDKMTDPITGFTGIVTRRSENLLGSTLIGLTGKGMDKGIPVELFWVEEQRLVNAVSSPPPPKPPHGQKINP